MTAIAYATKDVSFEMIPNRNALSKKFVKPEKLGYTPKKFASKTVSKFPTYNGKCVFAKETHDLTDYSTYIDDDNKLARKIDRWVQDQDRSANNRRLYINRKLWFMTPFEYGADYWEVNEMYGWYMSLDEYERENLINYIGNGDFELPLSPIYIIGAQITAENNYWKAFNDEDHIAYSYYGPNSYYGDYDNYDNYDNYDYDTYRSQSVYNGDYANNVVILAPSIDSESTVYCEESVYSEESIYDDLSDMEYDLVSRGTCAGCEDLETDHDKCVALCLGY